MTRIILTALLMTSCEGKLSKKEGNTQKGKTSTNSDYLGQAIPALRAALQAQINENWQDLKHPPDLSEPQVVIKILKSFKKFKNTLQHFEKNSYVNDTETQLDKLKFKDGNEQSKWRLQWNTVKKYIEKLAHSYTLFENLVDNPESSRNGLDELLESGVKPSPLRTTLSELHGKVMEHPELLTKLKTIIKDKEHYQCLPVSNHQMVYSLYDFIALAEIKGYVLLQFAYMFIVIYHPGDLATEVKVAEQKSKHRATELLQSVKKILPSMSRVLRRCDPETYREEESFVQVFAFLQGFIANENELIEGGSCSGTCSDYKNTKIYGCTPGELCQKQWTCTGPIYDCQFIANYADVCLSPRDLGRRYTWIQYNTGVTFGNKKRGNCTRKPEETKANGWNHGFYSCDYCFCKCDEEWPTSQRWWSLLPAVADVKSGYIMTGAQIILRDGIFYLKIRQAKPLPEGGVDKSTEHWVEPDTISKNATANLFHMEYNQRNMDLDQLSAPEGQVLTGIKLRILGNSHLNLEIQTTPIDYKTGELMKDNNIWIGNDAQPTIRRFLHIPHPDIPTMAPKGHQNKVDSKHNQYIKFETTSPNKDAAQTMIPFIDIQPVTMNSWLSGAGLYHKGQLGFGGFLGLQLETVKYSPYL